MMSALILATAAAASLFVLMFKLNIRRVLGYDAIVDVAVTLNLVAIMGGTLGGLTAAILAGLFMSILLAIAKKILGYEKLERDGLKLRWRFYPPTWRTDVEHDPKARSAFHRTMFK